MQRAPNAPKCQITNIFETVEQAENYNFGLYMGFNMSDNIEMLFNVWQKQKINRENAQWVRLGYNDALNITKKIRGKQLEGF